MMVGRGLGGGLPRGGATAAACLNPAKTRRIVVALRLLASLSRGNGGCRVGGFEEEGGWLVVVTEETGPRQLRASIPPGQVGLRGHLLARPTFPEQRGMSSGGSREREEAG